MKRSLPTQLKFGLLICCIGIPLMLLAQRCEAQKIKTSEYDKFLKVYRIQTSYATLKMGLMKALSATLRSVDTTIFITIYGSGNYVVGEGTPLIFLFQDDATLSVKSKGIQASRISEYTNFAFEYYIYEHQVKLLKEKMIKGVRLYDTNSYKDYDIDRDYADNMQKLASVFLKEFEKVKSTNVAKD
jgi:hypothetical protein